MCRFECCPYLACIMVPLPQAARIATPETVIQTMIKQLLFASAVLLGSQSLHAQYNLPQSRIWAMGNKVGLDFTNPANPTPIATNLQNPNEAAASICDTGGKLLFYTNGMIAWDSAGNAMPNGSSLIGMTGDTRSTTQGAAIVPVPDSAGKYYLFSLTAVSNCKLYVNKIDMSLNGGKGDVVTGFPLRHKVISDSLLTEKMTVVTGCNNSVWLVVKVQNSNNWLSYHITPAGIDPNPVVSTAGHFPGGHYQQGVIKFSPERGHMLNCNFRATAARNAGVEVFDFDYTTGIISNAIMLDSNSHYGGAFSPDGSKIYAGSTVVMNTGSIAQWNLGTLNPYASKVVLGACGQYTDLKLGPDGKIYFGAKDGGQGYSNYRFMGRINAPDSAGTACAFKDSMKSLIFPHPTNVNIGALTQGMPNDVAVPVPGMLVTRKSLDSAACKLFAGITLRAPLGYTTRSWDNGDTTATRNISARGTYWVRSLGTCDTRVDTFVIRGADMPGIAINRNGTQLSAAMGFQNYQWFLNGTALPGATSINHTIVGNGRYSVRGNFGSGCSDTASILVSDMTAIPNYPLAAQIRAYPNPANATLHIDAPVSTRVEILSLDGRSVQRSEAAAINTSSLPAGTYILRIADETGRRIAADRLVLVMH